MATVLVTGATGFVGRALLPRLTRDGHTLRATVRRPDAALPHGVSRVVIPDLADPTHGGAATDWAAAVAGVDAVIHLAALAHRRSVDEATVRRVNRDATLALGHAAVAAGVRRFIFLSSVKALGEASGTAPLRDTDIPRPQDAYGRAKYAAERELADLDLDLLVLRPPLVHGPGVKANLRALMRLARRPPLGLPLPLGGLDNRRSLIHVDHLADALALALTHPTVTGTHLLADRPALSTTELLRLLGNPAAPPRLFPLPGPLWRLATLLPGVGGMARRLAGSLELDDSPLRQALGWRPRRDARDALRATAASHRETGYRGDDEAGAG